MSTKTNAPAWAKEMMALVATRYPVVNEFTLEWSDRTDKLEWRAQYSSGICKFTGNVLKVRAGTAVTDQVHVLLHELAHAAVGNDAAHEMEWAVVNADLQNWLGDLQHAATFCGYRSTRAAAKLYGVEVRYRIKPSEVEQYEMPETSAQKVLMRVRREAKALSTPPATPGPEVQPAVEEEVAA